MQNRYEPGQNAANHAPENTDDGDDSDDNEDNDDELNGGDLDHSNDD